jgi:hypothetical protein
MCYCRDCQAFARFLGNEGEILDAAGGSDIVATTPRFVSFSQGGEQLRCMSLSPNGLLRWYAACCRTPVANTPRDARLSYVGLLHNVLGGTRAEIDAAVGPARVAIHTASALKPVTATPVATVASVVKIMGNVAAARLGGGYRQNPFFKPGSREPIAPPEVLSSAERRRLRGEAEGARSHAD